MSRIRSGILTCQPPRIRQGRRRAVDYIEFRKTMNEKYAKADERKERLRRRWRWQYPAVISLILIAAIVLVPIALRLMQ